MKKIFPNVAEKFPEKFPEGYKIWPQTWAMTREELMETLDDGTYKLLALDIHISEDNYVKAVNQYSGKEALTKMAEELYVCDIGCKHCFDCKTEKNNPLMEQQEVFDFLLEAKKLGLRMVKFLGPGELLHNPKLFEILDFLQEHGIRIAIFTKGLVLGKDSYAQEKFGLSSFEFCEKLFSYPGVSVVYTIGSVKRDVALARIDSKEHPDLFEVRNVGFENLVKVGFNEDVNNQRLSFTCAPVLNDNIAEVEEMYTWAIRRNIPMIVAPTMVSGKGLDQKEIVDEAFKMQLIDLYAKLYVRQIQNGLTSLTQLKKDGVSPYAGVPCNWYWGGFLQGNDGKLQSCPGNDSEPFVLHKNLKTVGSLLEQWKSSLNYALRMEAVEKGDDMPLTNPCYAKQENYEFPNGEVYVKKGCGSIPEGFGELVMKKVEEYVKVS